MKKIVFPTQYGETAPKGTFERFTLPSLTEPDNSMSIPEIIARYTRGQGIAVQQHSWQQGAALEEGETEIEENEFDFMPGNNPAPQPAQQQAPQSATPAPAPEGA